MSQEILSQKVRRVRAYLAVGKDYKRWRLWRCIQGSHAHRSVEAKEEIGWLKLRGFKAKVYAPLPQHKNSGHTHIAVLSTFHELCDLCDLTGITDLSLKEADQNE